jgi:FkbM family methyltransferase
LVFDIGANKGSKCGLFLKLGARVIAVEPDQKNQKVLREMFVEWRVFKKPIVIVPKAVSSERGTAKMWVQDPGSAMNTLSPKWVLALKRDARCLGRSFEFSETVDVESVTLQDLIETYGIPAFVKIDVEGHEVEVIRSLKSAVESLSFEVNLPEFRAEGEECVDLLESLAAKRGFNYSDDCTKGLCSDRWLSAKEVKVALGVCQHRSIEVFWKRDVGEYGDTHRYTGQFESE